MKNDEIKAFKELKDAITDELIVIHPDHNKAIFCKNDAGPKAVGGVLTQFGDEGNERPVAFGSFKLNKYQINYGQTKKELLAAVTMVNHWRHYLLGTTIAFKLITDCSAVRDLLKKKELSGILARWVMILTEFNFETIFKPGKNHQDADVYVYDI